MNRKTPGVLRWGRDLCLAVLLLAALMVGQPLRPVAAQTPEPRSPYAPVSAALAEKLAEGASAVSFLVVLNEQVDTQAVLAVPATGESGALARRTALYASLTETAPHTGPLARLA
ncbi:MAG: hypothetical protein IPK16_17010 [Anaerolineales bacterium]|nr:hypothetical protein [Anaerolineales bacterium]